VTFASGSARVSPAASPPPPQGVTTCPGAGLAAGLTLALPEAKVTVVEPEGWDDMRRSLEAGCQPTAATGRHDMPRRRHAQRRHLGRRLDPRRALATIVMPADAPVSKREGTLALGAEIVDYDRATESRHAPRPRIRVQRG
jgi:threonine dehydratase